MNQSLIFGISAVLALFPLTAAGFRNNSARDTLFWGALAFALAGPITWISVQMYDSWQTGLSPALWATIVASVLIFIATVIFVNQAWRLAPLVGGYLILVGVVALIWQHAPDATQVTKSLGIWTTIHIIVSVLTYGFVTLAAISALAAFLQERALKTKQPTRLTRVLPSVLDCEQLLVILLVLGECVLALGFISGIAVNSVNAHPLISVDHKTILTIATFIVIGGLLFAHYRTGIRGKIVTRFVLLAYLMLTLGYPGVKFVTDVLLKSA
ncbi:MAG: cytochrome C assembly family protein [Rhodospirillales bacterium]